MAQHTPTSNLFDRLFPEVRSDHGGLKLGDVIVLILDVVLLVYSGYWSWHFMQAPLPEADKAIALIGLWGLDAGAVFWSLTWIFGSTTDAQDAVSLTMFIIDLIGMTITSLVGSLGIVEQVGQGDISRWAVGIIIMLNIVMGFVYHMTSPQTKAARKRRKMVEDLAEKERGAELQLEQERLQIEQAERLLAQRQSLIEREIEMTRQTLELDGIKKGLNDALANSRGTVSGIASGTRRDVEKKVGGEGKSLLDKARELIPTGSAAKNGDENHPN